MRKLTHLGRDIIPVGHPILGFDGQEVNPTGVIRLPVRFGDKLKSKNLEINFLVVDMPTTYNVILGRPTLHKVKVVIVPYLFQLQFEADDGSIGEMKGDQRTARECYLVSIRPLVERTKEHGLDGKTYEDWTSHHGPRSVGHSHPYLGGTLTSSTGGHG